MNNWRLLLLAIVAVFQPITSFTDRNLIDGRQQCCDRLTSAPLRDTRSLLHGTYRLGKTTSALRRLNDRDEVYEDRYELRQRDSISSRPSIERPLVDIRGSVARREPSEIGKHPRVQYRLERPSNSQSRERLQDVRQRKETARSIRDLKPQDATRRVVERTSRDALERRSDMVYTESPRNSLFRDDYRTKRFGNERLSKNSLDSQREMQKNQFRSVERGITLHRDARRVLSRTKDDVTSIEASEEINNHQRIARERLNVVRRESSIRADTRPYIDHNDESQDLQRNSKQRRSHSENTRLVDSIRDMHNRLNVREETLENRQRIDASQRFTERFEDRRVHRDSRQNKENIDRRASGERMQVARRITREPRIMNEMYTQNERGVDDRREIRQDRSSEIRDEIRENPDRRVSSERIQMGRRNIRESRIIDTQNKRDVDGRRKIKHNERISRDTRGEIREYLEERLSRERIQMVWRNIPESGIMKAQNKRDVNGRRETRHNERETRDQLRGNLEQRLSLERIQMERINIREFRTTNTPNDKDVDSRQEIRSDDERSTEFEQNLKQKISSARIQMDRRNVREFRKMNNIVIRTERDVESRKEIRNNVRLHLENMENPDQRLSRERIQMYRRNIRESKIVNTLHERHLNGRQEIKYNERLTRKTREELRKNPDRRLTRESRQVDRQNIRESKINHVAIRNERSIETDTGSRRKTRNNERLSRQIRGDQVTTNRGVESRSASTVNTDERDNLMMDRKARSAGRRNFREIRAERGLSQSAETEPRGEILRNKVEVRSRIENREREAIDSRFRNVELARNRERISSVMVGKMKTENDFTAANWQYVLYTLQAAYLCALFMQMLMPSHTEKQHKMSHRWLPISSHYNTIKVD